MAADVAAETSGDRSIPVAPVAPVPLACLACLVECPVDCERFVLDALLIGELERLVGLKILHDDRLPKTMCDQCRVLFDTSLSFIRTVKESCISLLGEHAVTTNDKNVQTDALPFDRPLFSPFSDSDKENSNYDKFDSQDDCFQEINIKQEPEDYDSVSYMSPVRTDDIFAEDETVPQIKIEPLSENDAFIFHQEAISSDLISEDPENITGINNTKFNDVEEKETAHMNKIPSATENEGRSCKFCGLVITKNVSVKKHKELHRSLIQKCILCDKIFKTRKKLKKHVIFKHSYYETLRCKLCGMVFMHSVDFSEHRKVHLPSKKDTTCTLCNLDFNTKEKLTSHLFSHKEVISIQKDDMECMTCSKCISSFRDPNELLSHIAKDCTRELNPMEYSEIDYLIEELDEHFFPEIKSDISINSEKIEEKMNPNSYQYYFQTSV